MLSVYEFFHRRWTQINADGIPKSSLFICVCSICLGTCVENKRIQVKWKGEAEKWYPVATEILRRLVTDPEPVEFATELMLTFTFGVIRDAEDPLAEVKAMGAF
jgi:hypothetical protein